MSIKEENEITIKVACSNDELIKHLVNKSFNEGRKFTLDDYYLIPICFSVVQVHFTIFSFILFLSFKFTNISWIIFVKCSYYF